MYPLVAFLRLVYAVVKQILVCCFHQCKTSKSGVKKKLSEKGQQQLSGERGPLTSPKKVILQNILTEILKTKFKLKPALSCKDKDTFIAKDLTQLKTDDYQRDYSAFIETIRVMFIRTIRVVFIHTIRVEFIHTIRVEFIYTIYVEFINTIRVEFIHTIRVEFIHTIRVEFIHKMCVEFIHTIFVVFIHTIRVEFIPTIRVEFIHTIQIVFIHTISVKKSA